MSAFLDESTMNSNSSSLQFKTSWFWRLLPAGMRRRWWLFRLFDIVSHHWPVTGKRKGLLVVRMDGIGDMVLFHQALSVYSNIFRVPNSEIIVLGCKSWGSIADQIYQGYSLRIIDEHAFSRQPFYRLKIGLMVRKLNVETAICDSYFRRAMMADSLVWISAANNTIVSLPFINEPTRPEFTFYLSQVDKVIDTGPYPTHEVLRHFKFLSNLANRDILPLPPSVPWQEQGQLVDRSFPYVVLNPGSNEHGRRWPFESYLNVANHLLRLGYRVVIVGGQGEHAGNHREMFGEDERVIDLTGKTSLPELMNILKFAAGSISNDTGPAHLSIALGTPTVVIVGGGHFGSFVPYPEQITPPHVRFVYEKMSCYHCFWRCHKRAKKSDVFPCVGAVSEKKVISMILEVLP